MYDSTCKFIALEYSRDLATWLLGKPLDLRLFGLCYAMEGGYKGWNPYIERHLAIFVNCFCSRAN